MRRRTAQRGEAIAFARDVGKRHPSWWASTTEAAPCPEEIPCVEIRPGPSPHLARVLMVPQFPSSGPRPVYGARQAECAPHSGEKGTFERQNSKWGGVRRSNAAQRRAAAWANPDGGYKCQKRSPVGGRCAGDPGRPMEWWAQAHGPAATAELRATSSL